jgi:dihydropyrimidinase
MKTLLKGGTVVTGEGGKRADILIDGEKIAAVGRSLFATAADEIVDVSGCLLFPVLLTRTLI